MNGTMPAVITGPKLKAIRALRGMTQAELAHAAGVSPVTIATFEAGHSELRTGTIIKLCEALGVQVRYVIDGTEITGP